MGLPVAHKYLSVVMAEAEIRGSRARLMENTVREPNST